MQIPLRQFEQYIDETILQRGLSYFKKGRVNEPELISAGHYEVIVEGTENYLVRLKLKNGIITEYTCDCPYDFGPVCKHLAAVIFYLQQEELGIQKKVDSKKARQKPTKKKSLTQQVDGILAKLSDDELKEFVTKQATDDTSFRSKLFSTFAHLSENESKRFYAQQIKAILKTAAGQHGYIERRAARYVANAVSDLLDTAHKHVNNGNYKSAMLISFAVLEELTDALQFADDSNNEIGTNINNAYNLLVGISLNYVSEEIRKELFDYSIKSFESNIFFGWDWHLGMMEIASMIFDNENEAKKIIALLDQVKRKEFDYGFREAQALKLQILKKTRGEIETDKFIMQNIDNPFLRKEAILTECPRKKRL